MDLDDVVHRAKLLLAGLARYPGGADANSLIAVSHENEPTDWQDSPAHLRLDMRALDLLKRLEFVRLQQGGQTYELSDIGRISVSSDWPPLSNIKWLDEWVETEQLIEAMAEKRTSTENAIARLQVHNWRQFSDIDLALHP